MLFSNNFENFIKHYTRTMPRQLVVAIVERFGGETVFIKNYSKACYMSDNIKGWRDPCALADFFTDNKDEILAFISDEYEALEYNNSFEMIADLPAFDQYREDDNDYTAESVESALDCVGSSKYNCVAVALAYYSAEELARSYEFYLRDNPVCIQTKSNNHCNIDTRMKLCYSGF